MAHLEHLQNLNFTEVEKLKSDPMVLLIDVREMLEIENSGSIPGAINIPLKDLEQVLGTATSPGTFQEIYGREKPSNDFPIIFSCQSGRRSTLAQGKAINLGYTKVLNYIGGWLDWQEHIKIKN